VTQEVSKLEAVRRAVREVGEASPQDIAAFVEARFGVKILPRFVPVALASLRELEDL
jgi:hypothetical protein